MFAQLKEWTIFDQLRFGGPGSLFLAAACILLNTNQKFQIESSIVCAG
jgi:hypothetical protein